MTSLCGKLVEIQYVYTVISLYPSSSLQHATFVFLKVQLQAMFFESCIIVETSLHLPQPEGSLPVDFLSGEGALDSVNFSSP